jgi:hypothetical protein
VSESSPTTSNRSLSAWWLRMPGGNLFAEVRRRVPFAQVVVLGYPRFYVEGGARNDSTTNFCHGMRLVDQRWINGEIADLNDAIEDAARGLGMKYVDIYDTPNGHELCSDSERTFMNGLCSTRIHGRPRRAGPEPASSLPSPSMTDVVTRPRSGSAERRSGEAGKRGSAMTPDTPPKASDRRGASTVISVVLALLAVALVVAGALVALDTLNTMSTTPETAARGRAAYYRLLWCAAGMLVLAAAYWTVGQSRGAAILMGLAAVAAAFGPGGYLFTPSSR